MKKMNEWLQHRKNTTQFQLTIRFLSLLIATVCMLTLTFISITIAEIYESMGEQAKVLTRAIENRSPKTRADWQMVLSDYHTESSSTPLLYVSLESGEGLHSSEEAVEVFNEFAQFTQVLFFKHLLWSEEREPYYYQSFQLNGAKLTIMIDMEEQLEVISRIFSLTIWVTIIVLVIGALITQRFSKKLSQSLVRMNREIDTIETTEILTIPKEPQELKIVAQSFNDLLEKQRTSIKREQRFVIDASHELRTPLAAIRGHINLIKRRGEVHPEIVPTSLTFIDQESKRMELLVNQLLLLHKERKPVKMQWVDFSALVYQIIEELSIMIKQELTIEVDKDIKLLGEKEQYYQILRNLIENAAKYTPESGKIKIRLTQAMDEYWLSVEDTGIGIPDEAKGKIFERFYRVDQSRSSEITGSGIGLAIVKELVVAYGASITVTDCLPQGTCFTVKFKK